MMLVLFTIYLLICGYFAAVVLDRFFGLRNTFTRKILGIFAVFVSLSWLAGAAVLFVPLYFWVLALIFALNAIVHLILYKWASKKEKPDFVVLSKDELYVSHTLGARAGVVLFFGLVLYGFYVLSSSQTGSSILTPWQAIKPQYSIIFFLSVFILGLLVFARLKIKTILLCLIVQTFLLVSFLPFTHTLLYGADGWRHIANEQRFLDGKPFLKAQLAGEVAEAEKLSITSKVGQLSYSSFWSSNVILAKVFKTDLVQVTKWFLPVLWSLIFPILLFEIALAFGWGKKESLFVAWLGLLPFAWQAAGGFSLPVNVGLLSWLFASLLLLKRMQLPHKEQKLILLLVGLGFVFGYALYFILFWVAWVVAELLIKISLRKAATEKQSQSLAVSALGLPRRFAVVSLLAMTALVMAVIPFVELLAGYSRFDAQLNWLGQIKQVFGNFIGLYVASGPRSHDITTGNILFNQMPAYAFVSNIFTQWRWWIIVFCIGFLLVVLYGLFCAWKQKQVVGYWLAIISAGSIGGYIIANYFLVGDHILARRLDGVVAFFLIILFFFGLYELLVKIKRHLTKNNSKTIQLSIYIVSICVLSVAIFASYSLGPDTDTVSANEYEAVSYIWSAEKDASTKCVLGDTYPLLALEAVSSKEIIGGNFPIDANFGQLERVQLFEQSTKVINNALLQQIGAVTNADHCWIVGSVADFQKQGIATAGGVRIFGDVAVVKYSIVK
jgi:hypothetical protein